MKTIIHDTVEILHDTTVMIPADSAWLKGLLKCDSLGNAYLAEITDLKTGKNVKPKIIIKDNKIYVECVVDSASVYLHWKETRITNVEKSDSTSVILDPKIRSPSKFDNFLYVLRWIWDIWWLLFLLGWLVIRWINKKIPNF